jgi:hypothetical protein
MQEIEINSGSITENSSISMRAIGSVENAMGLSTEIGARAFMGKEQDIFRARVKEPTFFAPTVMILMNRSSNQ